MEQRLAPLVLHPPRGVHKSSWAPCQRVRRLLLGLLVITCRDYCDYIACNYHSSWRHHSCYPHGLNGPQFCRWAEAKEARVTDTWTKKCYGNSKSSLTLPEEKRLQHYNSVDLKGFSPKQSLWVGRETEEASLGFACRSSCHSIVRYCAEYRMKIFSIFQQMEIFSCNSKISPRV